MGPIKQDESNGVTCDWCLAGVCFVSSLENTDYNEFRRVFLSPSNKLSV